VGGAHAVAERPTELGEVRLVANLGMPNGVTNTHGG
jgi:hypothetical protein